MTIISTETLTPSTRLSASEQLQVYNGLDCCVTLEVFEELARANNQFPAIYDFERALQGPYFEIMQRGFKVDTLARQQAISDLTARSIELQSILDEFARTMWDRGLNPRSPKQLKEFFYEKMAIKSFEISDKGQRRVSVNREILEKIEEQYLYARPFVSLILDLREISKQKAFFETEIDPDGRIRPSYNIAGTETGRPSSSVNPFGAGTNMQNVSPPWRYAFVADRGKRLAVVDLEQVEARDVGFFIGCLFDDWSYLDAAEGGDLHTNNAKLIWRELPWTPNATINRKIAERSFYRDFSYRDMAKRGGHLSNYMGTAWTASRHLKVPIAIMEEFQARYIRGRAEDKVRGINAIAPAFPGIARFWQWIAQQLQTTAQLTTPFGRRRHFFGRPGDDATLREAIAFMPQSTTADRMNLGLWRVWRYERRVELLAQTYDSITFQFDESENTDEIIKSVLELIRVELVSPSGRRYVVPGEAKIGWNWGNEVTQADIEQARSAGKKLPRLNPEGLRKWKAGKVDERRRTSGLQRVMT